MIGARPCRRVWCAVSAVGDSFAPVGCDAVHGAPVAGGVLRLVRRRHGTGSPGLDGCQSFCRVRVAPRCGVFLFSTTTLAGPATLVPDQLSEALWKNVLYLATAAAIMAPLVLRGKESLPDASISTTVAELPETASVEQAVSVREPATRAASASLAVLCVVLMMITLKLRDPRPLESRWEVPVNAKSADQRIRARCAMPVNESRSISPEWMARWSLLTTTGQLLHRTRFWQHRDFGVAVAIRRPASGERVSAS